MQHSIIVRVAWGLSVFLVLSAIAFAWAANQRERRYEALIAEATRKAAEAATAPGAVAPAAAPSPDAAQAAFEKRCAKCHDPEEITEWAATLPESDTAGAALAFLQDHGKAPDAENRVIAAHVAAKGSF